MSIRIAWDNPEQTVIRMLFEGRWTLSDFDAAINQLLALSNSVEGTVYHLCDMSRCGPPPVGILWQCRRAYTMKSSAWGGVVVVTCNRVTLDLLGTFVKVYAPDSKDRILTATSVEEARALITRWLVKRVETP